MDSTRTRLIAHLLSALLTAQLAILACSSNSDPIPGTGDNDSGSNADASAANDSSTAETSTENDASSAPDTNGNSLPDSGYTGDAAVTCAELSDSFGSAVPLQNATATFSQTVAGQFTVAKAINGKTNDYLGWAILSTKTEGQKAAFETVSDTPAQTGGTRLLFILDQSFLTEHALGRFRLAYTTAARDQFADGNEGTGTPGAVGADNIWNVLTPRRMCASNDATLTVLGDSSVLAQDKNSTNAIYRVEADAPVSGITGFRIEVIEDPSLPNSGPGLQNSNGNFVLAEFTVRVGPQQ